MYSHVMLGVNNMETSKAFYDATLAVLGYDAGVLDERGRCFYLMPSGIFALTSPINGEPASGGNGSTIGFEAASSGQAGTCHAVGLEYGGRAIEDPPGIHERALGQLYIAYLLDPAGNKACVLHPLGPAG